MFEIREIIVVWRESREANQDSEILPAFFIPRCCVLPPWTCFVIGSIDRVLGAQIVHKIKFNNIFEISKLPQIRC